MPSLFESYGIVDAPVPVQEAPKKAPERTYLEATNDFIIDTANSAAGLVKAGADLVSPESSVSKFIDESIIKDGQAKQSDRKKFYRQELAAKLAETGKNDGTTSGELGAEARKFGVQMAHAFTTDPLGTAGEILGNLGPFAILGKGMQAANLAAGVRTAIASGVAGGLSAGEVRGNIWERISGMPDADLIASSPAYADLRQKGMTEAQAKSEMGANLSRNLPEVAIAGLIGALSGKYGVEGMAAGTFPKMGRLGAAVVGGIDEGVVQGGSEQVASNYGVQRVKPDQRLLQDVGQNIAAEGLPGVAMGVVSGGGNAHAPALHPVVAQAAEPNSPLSRAALAGNPNLAAPTAQPAAPAANPITQRATEIEAAVRDGQLLEKLRAAGQPTVDLLGALAAAKNPGVEPRLRQKALDDLELGLRTAQVQGAKQAGQAWQDLGIPQPADDLAAQEAANQSANAAGQAWQDLGITQPIDELQQQRDEATAQRLADAGQKWQDIKPIGSPAWESSELPMTAEQEDSQPPEQAHGPEATQTVETAQEGSPAPAAEPAVAEAPVARRQVEAPKVATPRESEVQRGSAQLRQRRAQLEAMASDGFDTVERRPDGFWLVNTRRNEEVRLANPGDAQMARKAVTDYIDGAAHQGAASPKNDLATPTEAQIEAENYKKGHLKINGMEVSIENPRGSKRSGTAPNGKKWSQDMAHHYGYFKRTEGADGDALDVFIGTRPDTDRVFVVDQLNQDGSFDEHKVMMGFLDEAAARQGYLDNYEKGWTGLGAITPMTVSQFKAWAKSDAAKQPASQKIAATNDQAARDIQADAAAVASLREAPGHTKDAIELADPSSPQTQALDALLDAMAKLTGHRGIAVKWTGKGAPDGAYAADTNRFVVNVDRPAMHVAQTIGHEFKHLTEHYPGLAKLYDRMWALIPQEARRAYFDGYLFRKAGTKYAEATPQQLALLEKEMLADFMGQRFNDRAWLEQLAKQKPALFGEFVADWIKLLNELIGELKALIGVGNANKDVDHQMRAYQAELEAAKAMAMDVAVAWAEQNPRMAKSASEGLRAGMDASLQQSRRVGPAHAAFTDDYLVPDAEAWSANTTGNLINLPALNFKSSGRSYGAMPVRIRLGRHGQEANPVTGRPYGQYGLQHRVSNQVESPGARKYGVVGDLSDGAMHAEVAASDLMLGVMTGRTLYAQQDAAKVAIWSPQPGGSDGQWTVMQIGTDTVTGEKFWDVQTVVPKTARWVADNNRNGSPLSMSGFTFDGLDSQQSSGLTARTLGELRAPTLIPPSTETVTVSDSGEVVNPRSVQPAAPVVAKPSRAPLARDANGKIILNKNKVQQSARIDAINDLGAFNLDAADDFDFDAAGNFLDAELQAQLQAELETENAKAEKAGGRRGDVSDADIEAQGVMAEEAYGPLHWEDKDGGGIVFTAEIPDLYEHGKVGKVFLEGEEEGTWGATLRHTWLGPTENEEEGYVSRQAAEQFVQRFVAAKDLARRGFDLADSITPEQTERLLKAWASFNALDSVRRYESVDDGVTGLHDIAKAMGLTQGHDIKFNKESTGPGSEIISVGFINKANGDAQDATLEIHRVDGKKVGTAHTSSLRRGGLGAAFYQLMSEYAGVNNIRIAPDHSLSGINTYRRTEQQLSAALRTGKSTVMTPHPVQRVYGFDNEAKTQSEHAANVARLLLAGLRNAREIVPEVEGLDYSPETGDFLDFLGDNANDVVQEILGRHDVRAFGFGRSTLARAAMTRMILDDALSANGVKSFREPVLYSAREDDGSRGVIGEVAPHPEQAVAQEWDAMTDAEKQMASRNVAGKIVRRVFDDMGLKGWEADFSSGSWNGKVNPNFILSAPEDATQAEINEVARVLGYVFDQQAMVAFDEGNTESANMAGFVKVVLPGGMPKSKVAELRDWIGQHAPRAGSDTLRDGALVFGNFTAFDEGQAALDDAEYRAAIRQAVLDFEWDGAGIEVTEARRSHSELIWPDGRNDYLKGTRYGNSDRQALEAGRDDFRLDEGRHPDSAIQRIADDATRLRQQWIDASATGRQRAERRRAGAAQAGAADARVEYGQPGANSAAAVGVHFSQQPRAALSSQYFGTGLKGLERERLGDPANADIKPRLNFYVDNGSGVHPEAGVGAARHVVRLNNLYDTKADPLGLVKNNRGPSEAARASSLERAVMQAGFDGYLADTGANQNFAVLIGKHQIPMGEVQHSKRGVRIDDHDKWSIYQERSAQVGDGFVRWVEDPDMAYVTDLQAGPKMRGRALLKWLRATAGKKLYAVGVVDDAQEFWDKMESADLVDGQTGEAFMSFFGRSVSHSARDATETLEFKKWFGDSKVVDSGGKPLVVYHGTQGAPTQFKKARMGSASTFLGSYQVERHGIFAAESHELAEEYANQGERPVSQSVMPLYLSIQSPLDTVDGHYTDEVWANISSAGKRLGMENPYSLARFVGDLWGRGEMWKLFDADEHNDPAWNIAMFKEAGYDGLRILERSEGDVQNTAAWVAFDPTQVKSATGNSGDFDGADPDIRHSIRAGTSAWDGPEVSRFDDFVYKAQNKMIDAKRVVESIGKTVGTVAEDINVYLQEELFHGRAAKRVADFGQQELNPLMERMKAQGLSLADVEEYMHARHAREANRVIADRNPGDPGMQDGGSGMTDAAADMYFANLPPDLTARLDAMAVEVDAIIAKTRQLYADYGLESQDTVDSWGQMFQHYVPLQREDKDGTMGIGQGFSVKGRETRGRTGSKRKVVDILANIAMQRERLIVRGEKNRVSQALVGLARANPNPDFWSVGPPPSERVYDPKTNEVVERVDPLYKSRDNVLVAKVKQPDGSIKEVGVNFNEDDPRALRMVQALKNLDVAALEGLMGVSAKITRYFSAVNTQYNPVFGVVNLIRDVQSAMLNLDTTPLAKKKGRIARDTVSALTGIYQDMRAARRGQQPTSAWAVLWDEFQEQGGQTGYRQMFATSQDRADELQKILTPHGWMESGWGKIFTAGGALKVPLAQAQKGAGAIFDWLSDYNESMENGVRLAAYKAGLDSGMSKTEAASLAKNLTVNFNRKGQVGQQAGAVYAFFNAAMQGSARIASTLFTMEGGDIKTVRLSSTGKKVVYGGMLLGAMQALALAAAGFGDDDPPEFVRAKSLIIPTGWAGVGPGKGYLSIPMPQGFNVLPGLGRSLTEFALSGFKHPAKRVFGILGLFADSFNPIGNAGLSMQTLAPTALDPLVALTENRDFTGKPIARTSSNKALPGHSQYKDTASTVGKLLAEAINGVTGGNAYVAGVLSPTPDQIDYLIGQVTGGVGRELGKVEQSLLGVVRGEDVPLHKIPLAGRFVGNSASQASQAGEFYANINRLNELETEVKGLRKDGKGQEAAALLRERPDAYLVAQANVAERQLQRLRREKREMVERGATREQVQAKEAQMTQVMTRLNQAVERLREVAH